MKEEAIELLHANLDLQVIAPPDVRTTAHPRRGAWNTMGVRAKTTGNHQALIGHGCKQEHAGCRASGQACLGIERVFEQARRHLTSTQLAVYYVDLV